MTIKQKKHICKILTSTPLFDEPLSKHTTFGIGGPATCLVFPNDEKELSNILKFTKKENIKTFFGGSGSNLLIWDDGFDGCFISLKRTFKKFFIDNDNKMIAESGVMLGKLVKDAIHSNLTGFESLIGVPGTLGGALIMNAGAFGSEISTYLVKVRSMDQNGNINIYEKNDITFDYRYSNLPKNEIIIDATFQCIKGNPENIKESKLAVSNLRKQTQPLRIRSAGSIFKNPSKKIAAGYLIDKSGIKGKCKGGACISEKHANFFVNQKNATAADVFYLIKTAKDLVAKLFNINLELEVKLVGFPQNLLDEIAVA